MQALRACHLPCATLSPATPTNCASRGYRSPAVSARLFRAFAAPRKCLRTPRSTGKQISVAAAPKADTEEHLQLATAKLPKGLDVTGFLNSLYQWAATLTSSGQNMPFALPIRADKVDQGFQMSLLRIKDGSPMSVGDIVGSVESVEGKGDVLFVRFFEGPASGIDRQGPPPSNPRERIQKNAEALIDIPIIMQTMKGAIQTAVAQNAKS